MRRIIGIVSRLMSDGDRRHALMDFIAPTMMFSRVCLERITIITDGVIGFFNRRSLKTSPHHSKGCLHSKPLLLIIFTFTLAIQPSALDLERDEHGSYRKFTSLINCRLFTTSSMHGLRNCINVQEVCVNKFQENVCQGDGFLLNAVMSTTISVRWNVQKRNKWNFYLKFQ